ncbi:MAG: DUF1826 domain-containing protein [Dechloromonas sp.]|nr:DUF1826 domain-containing protein [Dechloromonas sp.]
MNAPLPRNATRCCAIADDPLGLTRIFDPETQLAQWHRSPNPVIADWLAVHAGNLGSGLRQTLATGQLPDLGRLPPGDGRDALATDIALLAEILGELLDATSIGYRLEVLGKAMCPRLHVDRVGIRLLCTYRGPGTEWVEDACVDRRFLGAASGGQPDETSGLLLAGHRIETIPPFTVALLKGSLWQGNDGRGIVHRSPAIAAEQAPRVLLAMDAGWE